MYLIGYDIGSSSIKAALVEISTGNKIAVVQHPEKEMPISAHQPDWAEQNPEDWWLHVCQATKLLLEKTQIKNTEILAIGIAYQMHGLVLLDKEGEVVRPAIIWCDSRAVSYGRDAFQSIGESFCLSHYLNSPGNFTASKLKWVKDNEPKNYTQAFKMMLPGDYIAYRMTGQINSTITGLSEGILWDFKKNTIAKELLDHFELDHSLIPEITDNFSIQARLSAEASDVLGLNTGTPVTYRAGDQPNNAMTLNVLNPGEIAATGGTSGVVYAVTDKPIYDQASRVNGFAHVNHSIDRARIGILLCINGAGIQYGWVRNNLAPEGADYFDLEEKASKIPIGSEGLMVIPFGNGAERVFKNKNIGAQVRYLHFNRHNKTHFYRAALEGIAFAFVYGIEILREMGISVDIIRVGNDNLFLSNIFSQTISNLTGAKIEMIDATGAVGAALAAGVGVGAYSSLEEAQKNINIVAVIKPNHEDKLHEAAYLSWKKELDGILGD